MGGGRWAVGGERWAVGGRKWATDRPELERRVGQQLGQLLAEKDARQKALDDASGLPVDNRLLQDLPMKVDVVGVVGVVVARGFHPLVVRAGERVEEEACVYRVAEPTVLDEPRVGVRRVGVRVRIEQGWGEGEGRAG